MREFFAGLYEWFGMNFFYSVNMGEHLRGLDTECTDYISTPWYVITGCSMIVITAFVYALQYHIIDSSRCNKKQHWWLFALMIVVINFLTAFVIALNSLNSACKQFQLSVSDCIGFGNSNAIWSFILFLIISTVPLFRTKFSTNCRNTTFWKP